MTERLDWQDVTLREWTAWLVAQREGNQVALDRSAFYPEGGGQPADHGTINGVAVLDVQAADDGTIWHTLATPLQASLVECVLDWPRRFDHMQQHHGQHLLSAAFENLIDAHTIAFHLGANGVTIDLDVPNLSVEQLAAVEELANFVIWEDYPINARFVAPQELASIRLRKPPSVTGAIRVVSVADFDHSACGGTHPRSTGGVGVLHIRGTERRGATTRVEFVCGRRALHDLRWKNTALGRLASSFSGSQEQVEVAVARLREAETAARKNLQAANSQLLQAEARELLAAAPIIQNVAVVAQIWPDRDPNDVRTLAQAVAELGGLALLGVQHPKAQLFFAGGGGAVDCGTLLREVIAPWNGKGGGNANQAQGGLPNGEHLAAAIERAREKMSNA